ncbi:MAG: hypothetical protein ACC652_14100 [Acidimicrobiales bacterium]
METLGSELDHYAKITPEDSTQTMLEAFSDADFANLTVPTISEDEPAYDFELAVYDFSSGGRVETSQTFHLQEKTKNQPVALIFGSYT